jgi:hypothetical protein
VIQLPCCQGLLPQQIFSQFSLPLQGVGVPLHRLVLLFLLNLLPRPKGFPVSSSAAGNPDAAHVSYVAPVFSWGCPVAMMSDNDFLGAAIGCASSHIKDGFLMNNDEAMQQSEVGHAVLSPPGSPNNLHCASGSMVTLQIV